ncbi:CBS domain-containing protein [Streptomyces nigra]
MATARDIMTESDQTLPGDASLRAAAQVLVAASLDGVPVVAQGVLTGVVTGADVVIALADGAKRVASATRKVPTVEEHADVHVVRHALAGSSAGMIAVVDRRGRPVGLITERQLEALDKTVPELDMFGSHKPRAEGSAELQPDCAATVDPSLGHRMRELFKGDGKPSTMIRRAVALVLGPIVTLLVIIFLALTAAQDANALVVPIVASVAISVTVLGLLWFVIARHQARKH